MPSQKTAEKPATNLVKIIAVRKFAVELSPEKLKQLQADDKENRSYEGLSRMVEIGESAEVTKAVAKIHTKSGAAIPNYD